MAPFLVDSNSNIRKHSFKTKYADQLFEEMPKWSRQLMGNPLFGHKWTINNYWFCSYIESESYGELHFDLVVRLESGCWVLPENPTESKLPLLLLKLRKSCRSSVENSGNCKLLKWCIWLIWKTWLNSSEAIHDAGPRKCQNHLKVVIILLSSKKN